MFRGPAWGPHPQACANLGGLCFMKPLFCPPLILPFQMSQAGTGPETSSPPRIGLWQFWAEALGWGKRRDSGEE